jgi:hypothetical protein
MSYLRYLCLFAYNSGVQHILCYNFFLRLVAFGIILRLVYSMLPSVFSNVYLQMRTLLK